MKNRRANLHIVIFVCLLAVTLCSSMILKAQERLPGGDALVQAHRCYACHHMTDVLIGPPYRAIAARHGAQKSVMADVLARKIILGGGGSWGVVPMVPNEQVSEAEARAIARWILDLDN